MISRDHPSTSTLPAPPFRASDHATDTRPHLLLCASGSVATIKLPQMLMSLSAHPISIRVVLTPSASRFLQAQSAEQPPLDSLAKIPNVEAIYEDHDEWEFSSEDNGLIYGKKARRGWVRGDPILHIELRRWADLMLVAPLSANTLAKITGGMAEGLLASVIRAWDTDGKVDGIREFPRSVVQQKGCVLGQKKRIIVAPAMNTAMWRQPVTTRQISVLTEEWGIKSGKGKEAGSDEGWFEVLTTIEKELACGDLGGGAMMEWRDIIRLIEARLGFGG